LPIRTADSKTLDAWLIFDIKKHERLSEARALNRSKTVGADSHLGVAAQWRSSLFRSLGSASAMSGSPAELEIKYGRFYRMAIVKFM